jgi:hypothetical protein
MRQYLLLPIVIAAAILIALSVRAPLAISGSSDFDRTRAKASVAALSIAPRPVGSIGNEQARAWLQGQFEALGLDVESQSGVGVRQANFDKRRKGYVSVSPYNNVIAVLPGRNRSLKAVALMAHIDSAPWAHGAADDAAGVAVLVETARVLSSGAKPLRDVVFLVTDAEELGLVGAQEFFEYHPLAKHVGAVVNLEARGSHGRAVMFQTSPGNGALVDLWAKNAVHPAGNSLANSVYQLLPNDTDLSIALKKGKLGVNAAFIDGFADYHMPTDTPENLSQRSLSHLGSFALTTMRALVNAPQFPAQTADAAYFDVFGLFVPRYPLIWGWGLAAVAALGLGLAGIGRIGVNWAASAKATLGVLALTAVTGAALHYGMNWLSGSGMLAQRDRINEMDGALWIFLALIGGALLVARPKAGMWVGGAIISLLAAIAAQIWLPGGSWVFGWAALLAVVMLIVAARTGLASRWTIYGSALVGGLWLALLLEILITAYMTMGPATPVPLVLAIPLALALLGPVFADASGLALWRKAGAVFLVIGTGLLVWLSFSSSFSARHPMPGDFFHLSDTKTGKSWWATGSTARQLPSGNAISIKPKGFDQYKWKAVPAAAISPAKPVFTFNAVAGRIALTVSSVAAPRALSIAIEPSKTLQNVRVNGRPVQLPAGQATRVLWRSETPEAKLVVEFDKGAGQSMTVHYLYALAGLPQGAPRYEGIPTDWALLHESKVTTGVEKFGW